MYNEPIFLEPVFQERIWGGKRLHSLFGYEIPTDLTGEAWVISAHENGLSKIINGPLADQTLLEAWNEYPALFGKRQVKGDFPLLVKILDATEDLSVQVHPNDDDAKKMENENYGKTECWYVLDCKEDSEIVYGHEAASKEAFRRKIDKGKWDELLTRVNVKKGDFFYVPSGMIHAIGKGIVILEIQQSSDITYRLYDYDRLDDEGNYRELHIESAIKVTNFPDITQTEQIIEKKIEDLTMRQLIKGQYFTVYHWQLNGEVNTPLIANYLLVSIIDGSGAMIISDYEFQIKKGDHFIIPATIKEYELNGHLEVVIAHD